MSICAKGWIGTRNYEKQSIALTSPGIVYKDLIIVGGRNPETHPAPPGYVRAYDVRTGQLRWVFHTIPLPGEPGYETWPKDAYKTAGAANNWAGMTLDAARGIVYVPTGSAVMDFYGGDRVGDDLYANCELALDANTGKLLWHFQGVHHDIWDRDFPSPPALVTLQHDGKTVEALAQTSKQGYVYLFDRVTGESLYPMNERPYPASTVPGEVAAKTQALPGGPEPYARQRLTEDMLTTRTPEMHAWAVQQFRTMRSDGQFVPMVAGGQQTIVFPGFDGGAEWGGPAVDPVNDILYVNANEMAWLGGLIQNPGGSTGGMQTYMYQCAVCHGVTREGSPPAFPSLVDIGKKLTDEQITHTVKTGAGRMPSFPNIDDRGLNDLLHYLRTGSASDASANKKELGSTPAASDSAPPPPADPRGAAVFKDKCAACHGEHLEGKEGLGPTLMGLGSRLSADQTKKVIYGGKGKMPQIPDVVGKDMEALLRFLRVGEQIASVTPPVESEEGPYIFTGYRKFLDPEGYPAFVPPWGTLNAIDLKTGKYLWKVPLGEYPALAQQGMKDTGTENYGGPVLTAGGVLFIGATVYDRRFRAFDSSYGQGALGDGTSVCGNGDSVDVHDRRPAVRGDCGERGSGPEVAGGRGVHRICVAGKVIGTGGQRGRRGDEQFIAFSSPLGRVLGYAGCATWRLHGWIFRKNSSQNMTAKPPTPARFSRRFPRMRTSAGSPTKNRWHWDGWRHMCPTPTAIGRCIR